MANRPYLVDPVYEDINKLGIEMRSGLFPEKRENPLVIPGFLVGTLRSEGVEDVRNRDDAREQRYLDAFPAVAYRLRGEHEIAVVVPSQGLPAGIALPSQRS